MNAEAMLTDLAVAGISLVREGDAIFAHVLPGTDLTPHTERIKAHRPALLAALELREQIIAAVTIEPADFDRPAYDALWARWHTENPS